MALFGFLNKKEINRKLNYPAKTIILPKKFMKEYKLVSDMKHIKEMFEGYEIIEKETFIHTKFGDGKTEAPLVDETTKINIFPVNVDFPCGLIIEGDYYCFFVEVFVTNKNTGKQFRTGLYLVVIEDRNILNIEDKNKLIITVKGGAGYAFMFYDFKTTNLVTHKVAQHKKANSKVLDWYVGALSQFLNINGYSLMPPGSFKPK